MKLIVETLYKKDYDSFITDVQYVAVHDISYLSKCQNTYIKCSVVIITGAALNFIQFTILV